MLKDYNFCVDYAGVTERAVILQQSLLFWISFVGRCKMIVT